MLPPARRNVQIMNEMFGEGSGLRRAKSRPPAGISFNHTMFIFLLHLLFLLLCKPGTLLLVRHSLETMPN
jgi:hypothetical protein